MRGALKQKRRKKVHGDLEIPIDFPLVPDLAQRQFQSQKPKKQNQWHNRPQKQNW